MSKNNKNFNKMTNRPEFSLEGMFANQKYNGGRHVAGSYFNMAFENFYKTLTFVMTRAGIDLKLLKELNYSGEKMAEVLSVFKIATFGTEEEKSKYERYKLTDDVQMRFQRLLFNKMPVFGPIMGDVASFEVYKNRQRSDVIKDKNQQAIQRGIPFEKCLEELVPIAECLIYYRNYYTHKHPYNTIDAEKKQALREVKLVTKMDAILKASQRIDKKRLLVSTANMEFLTGYGINDRMERIDNGKAIIETNGRKTEVTLWKFKEKENFYFKIRGKKYNSDTVSGYYLSDFGKLFFCCLFLERNYVRKFTEETALFAFSPFCYDEAQRLKAQEVVNKQEAEENKLRKDKHIKEVKHKEVRKEDSLENLIIREMLSTYHIRKPREKRIDSRSTIGTLTMDMLNELRRCPKVLFDTFSEDGKRKFEREVSVLKNKQPIDGNDQENALLTRSKDRFPYFALRYIDLLNVLGDIRFQVRLGNYRFHFYNKTCIDGTPKVRTWQKEITGFGKWQEIEEKRKKDWEHVFQKREIVMTEQDYGDIELEQPIKDYEGMDAYITDWHTAYNIHTNRIGMTWGLESGYYLPILQREGVEHEANGEKKTVYKAPIDLKIPKCSMSVYDLPALMFYNYLATHNQGVFHQNNFASAEEIIKSKYDALRIFFQKVAEGAQPEEAEELLASLGLRQSEIPDKMREFINKGNWKTKYLKMALRQNLIESLVGTQDGPNPKPGKLNIIAQEAASRAKAFKQKKTKIDSGKENKYAKNGYADIRHGVLARYIAKSLVKWQPTKTGGHDKITGLNYSMMTAFLATYGQNSGFAELNSMLHKANLIESCNPHPFILDVLNVKPRNIEQLYEIYLRIEEKYAKELIAQIKKGENVDEILSQLPFARSQGQKWQLGDNKKEYYKDCAKRLLCLEGKDAIIMLPDSLFTTHLLRLMQKIWPQDTLLNDHTKAEKYGAAYLIQYFIDKKKKNDSHQPFYNPNIPEYRRAYKPFTTMHNVFVKNAKGNDTSELVPFYMNTKELKENLATTNEDIRHFVYKVWKSMSHDKAEKVKSLKRQIKEVKDSERLIRRFQTEDVVLFLMAKDLLIASLAEGMDQKDEKTKKAIKQIVEKAEHLKLKNFCFDEAFHFLSEETDSDGRPLAGIDYEFDYAVNVAGQRKTIKIRQHGVSLKNYGNISRLLGDERTKPLMEKLAAAGITEITFNDLTSEFANFDDMRSDILLHAQELEDVSYQANEVLLTDPSADGFYVRGEHNGLAIRNSFINLIRLLSIYSDEDVDLLNAIRRSVAHNEYKVELRLLHQTEKKNINVPNIALLMEDEIKQKVIEGLHDE